jgi:hypothetical protein
MATLNANSNPAYIAIQAFLGVADESHQTGIDFQSASTVTGAALLKSPPINLTGLATTSFSLATYFSNALSPVFFGAMDITSTPGQNFGISLSGGASTANFFMVGPNAAFGYACDGNILPSTVYLYNPNATVGIVQLVCITN